MKLSKTYEPNLYENDIYALWEKSNAFKPNPASKAGYFSIVLPPPNANGSLHVGHCLMFAIQDVTIRYQRMLGKSTLWVPGADHAGFETQVVYEKQLTKEGKSRFDFQRDELYSRIWDFVEENRGKYQAQFRQLGASVDWSKDTYTLDPIVISRAYKTFKKMWDDGLIYRGERLVNFCTFHGTAFADIEVEHKEEQGNLWHIAYPLTDGSGEVVVATTRPETMFGDVAVAVHPEDERYKHLIGKTAKLPLTEREIPIIADKFVDREFGTGAVKITPAHDPNDFEVGQRHDLPKVTVINHEGVLVDVPEKYRGLEVLEGRKQVVSDLKKHKYLQSEELHTHSVGHCYKCGTVIQPLLREQWFIDVQPLAKPAIAALKAGKINFYPESKKTQLILYLENLRDWNISRQIAWGIPIPAFQNIDDSDDWIYDERVDNEFIEHEGKTYRRDPDVFDTWFSSGHWPFVTLGYPESDELADYYPNSLMETGGEILYPWVSRMIMLGLYITGKIPFKDVYIHGYVLAEDGSKMSKSVGNVIDPIAIIDQYGSDALRMGLLAGRAPAVNRGYDQRKVVDARNFCNKLWNVARFIENTVGESYTSANPEPTTIADHWILYKLQQTIEALSNNLNNYQFSEAYDTLYHFVWDDLADWYIEASKKEPNSSVLGFVLESVLALAHPFAPFATETIWQALGWRDGLLINASWPNVPHASAKQARVFEEVQIIVTEARYIMAALKAPKSTLYHKQVTFLNDHAALITQLARLQKVVDVRDGSGLRLTSTKYNCWLDIDSETASAYAEELKAKLEAQDQLIRQFRARLDNTAYIAKAPKRLVDETKEQLEAATMQKKTIQREYERFTR
jgi:valyl-tRNA synthetase